MKKDGDISSLEHTAWRCQYHVVFGECPNPQLKEVKKRKGDRRAGVSGTIEVLLKPEAVIGPYENCQRQ